MERDIGEIALQMLEEEGKAIERDLTEIGSDPYKPFYRIVQILVSKTFLDAIGKDRTLPLPEVKETLKESHDWFKEALRTNEWQFDNLYEDFKELWDDVYDREA